MIDVTRPHDPIVKTEYCYCKDCMLRIREYFIEMNRRIEAGLNHKVRK